MLVSCSAAMNASSLTLMGLQMWDPCRRVCTLHLQMQRSRCSSMQREPDNRLVGPAWWRLARLVAQQSVAPPNLRAESQFHGPCRPPSSLGM
jgi:hypothetical protein